MHVSTPAFKFEWNLNTVVVLIGFAAGFVAWGYTIAELKSGRQINTTNINRMEIRLERLENNANILSNHELRITSVEKMAMEATTDMRAVNTAIASMASDIRIVTEILKRIEAVQGSRPTLDR